MNYSCPDVILICTTESELNGIITKLLEPKGFQLISALNQHMLIRLIEIYSPSAVIADFGLSVIMGYTPFEIIKRVDRFKNTKIVLITSESLQSRKDSYPYVDSIIGMDSVSAYLLPTICNYSSSGPEVQINEEARRLANAIVSDIVHYNSVAAYRSAANGTFYDILSKEIEQGRALFEQRISVNMPHMSDYFNNAIMDFINKTQHCNLVLP